MNVWDAGRAIKKHPTTPPRRRRVHQQGSATGRGPADTFGIPLCSSNVCDARARCGCAPPQMRREPPPAPFPKGLPITLPELWIAGECRPSDRRLYDAGHPLPLKPRGQPSQQVSIAPRRCKPPRILPWGTGTVLASCRVWHGADEPGMTRVTVLCGRLAEACGSRIHHSTREGKNRRL
jgi:hypothetical protein